MPTKGLVGRKGSQDTPRARSCDHGRPVAVRWEVEEGGLQKEPGADHTTRGVLTSPYREMFLRASEQGNGSQIYSKPGLNDWNDRKRPSS